MFSAHKIAASLVLAAVAVAVAASVVLASSNAQETELTFISAKDAALDFCDLHLVFKDEFDEVSVAPVEIGKMRWIAHTPWNGDFGDAAFANPGPGFPFTVKDGILSITAKTNEQGKWESGLIASADSKQNGFSLLYGYFEARMKLPDGPGVWPAFWLVESEPPGRTEPNLEVDVVEYYGHNDSSYNSSLHVWHRTPTKWVDSKSRANAVAAKSLSADFHSFGVKVTQETTTYYLDRTPYWQVATPTLHKMPYMLLVNLAAGSGFPIDKMPNPAVLEVDYVRAYSLKSHEDRGGDLSGSPKC